MTAGFSETVVGGVLVAPFVRFALGAFLIVLLLVRPLLRLLPMSRIFADPPLVVVCLYLVVVAILVVLF